MRSITYLTTAAAALALAACGGSGVADEGPSSGRDAAFQGALAFARCMRSNGVDMPDPQSGGNGRVRMVGGAGFDPEDPAVERAHKACEKHLRRGGGDGQSPQERAKFRDAFVAYAQCMRQEGVDMPDPNSDGGMVFRKGEGPDSESPQFKAADQQCRRHLAELPKPTRR